MIQAPPILTELVTRFEQNRDAYKSQGYNETQLRREFLDPLFEALGWDVANKAGHAEAYKDVIHEDAIKIGGYTKAPDYCFRIGGARKFFLEAKKPAVNLKDDLSPAYQLRRYAWSAKLPLSILTDFEEFAVYDCRTRPNPSDKSSAGRILYLTYRDYLARWDEIASVFTKDAVLKGSFDKYAVTDRKRGTATVDAEFLKEIEIWREALAKNLAVRNPKLSVHELNFSVQRTIDRIIFLRICEDRGVEPYAQLQALLNGQNIYSRLRYLYDQADDRYNSGLFHFHPEKDRAESPDDLTPRLKIDDKVLKDLIDRLYYPQSPYEFSVLPIEILGQVYEQFLGKVIRLTSGHQAKVEEKPEVKKAGGVYYTPAYIVDYIVKHTVGSLSEAKTPKQIARLRILDPACGSGSFLIGAYQYLLTYHRDWYVNDGAEKHRKELFQAASGEWRLTTQEKKRILVNNIYGVDIDNQAVEVTKLSLLLKVLEGESEETLKRQLSFVKERALPDLGKNIKCGNSLIGPDYFAGQLMPDEDEMRRVNPFDWQAEFSEIMKDGGFDVVIGNPPWGSLISQTQKEYLNRRFSSKQGEAESHLYFIEQGIRMLKDHGTLGFITPNTWLAVLNSQPIREYLLSHVCFRELTQLSKYIFQDAPDIVPLLCFLEKHVPTNNACDVRTTKQIRIHEGNFASSFRREQLPQQIWSQMFCSAINLYLSKTTLSVLEKCESVGVPLNELCNVLYGIKTGDNSRFLSTRRTRDHTKKALKTGEISRYSLTWRGLYLWWSPDLAGYRDASLEIPKIVVQYIRKLSLSPRIVAAVDVKGEFYPLNNYSFVSVRVAEYSLLYIAGVLNSRLLDFLFANTFIDYNIKPTYLQRLPIRPLSFSSSSDRTEHARMVSLVERMLDLHKRIANASPNDKTGLQRQIDATDQEIDRLVYDLYGLTEEEIKIVEAASVASSTTLRENEDHGPETEPVVRLGSGRGAPATVAQPTQYAGEGGGGAPEGPPGAGEPVHGVREPTSQYGAPQDPDGDSQGQGELASTREFETAEGRLSYREVSERLAVPLVGIYDDILQSRPEQIIITTEWLCLRHKRLAGHLFPDWAGRFRDVNVQVGSHIPPPYYEVPIYMRQFCDDLAERMRSGRSEALSGCADLLAWADWRFQWIHPFKDFNGRIGRVVLAALLYKLALPHVETAPTDPAARQPYLNALRAADQEDLAALTDLWVRRIGESA